MTDSAFVSRYPVRQVGGDTILELWVPTEELEEFNDHIIGTIEIVHEFPLTSVMPPASRCG
jgi:hypothetical protein